MNACSVLGFADPQVIYKEEFIVCTKSPKEGPNLRTAMQIALDKEAGLVTVDDPDLEMHVPYLAFDVEFEVIIIKPSTGDHSTQNIHIDDFKIWKRNELDIQIRYRDIDSDGDKCQILTTPNHLEKLSDISGIETVVPECCWSYISNLSETFVCQTAVTRCLS